MSQDNLLALTLQVAVPLQILAIQGHDGPDRGDYDRAKRLMVDLCEYGDELLYKSKTPGKTANLFNELAHGIAVLAFCPGGITIFGSHWKLATRRQSFIRSGQSENCSREMLHIRCRYANISRDKGVAWSRRELSRAICARWLRRYMIG